MTVAELVFTGVPLTGLSLIGLGLVWSMAMHGRKLTAKERYWQEAGQRRRG